MRRWVLMVLTLACLASVPAAGGDIERDWIAGDVLLDTIAYQDGSAVVITMTGEGNIFTFTLVSDDTATFSSVSPSQHAFLPDWAVVRASGRYVHLTLNWLNTGDIEHFRYELPEGAIAFGSDGTQRVRIRIYLPAIFAGKQ